MQVFISWSGEQSRRLAEALRDWLPGVLQAVEPWLSSRDALIGEPFSTSLTRAFASSEVGVVCVTKNNLHSPWLHFEAGVLSSAKRAIALYGLGVSPSELTGPLAQFQMDTADSNGTYRLLRYLNSAAGNRQLTDESLNRAFSLWWPVLERTLENISNAESAH